MASPGGTSSGSGYSSMIQNSGSEEELQALINQRKLKRMQSNRESARRSRMRKQRHLDDLMGKVLQLKRDNSRLLAALNVTTQHCLRVEAENSVLRTQTTELEQRLQSLEDILSFMNGSSPGLEDMAGPGITMDSFFNPIDLLPFTQPIMLPPDMLINY